MRVTQAVIKLNAEAICMGGPFTTDAGVNWAARIRGP
jgi:hypothetical protein